MEDENMNEGEDDNYEEEEYEEEEYEEDYKEQKSHHDNELLPVAFKVDGEFPPEAGTPMSGLDYLRRVRWEARNIPAVVVSNINPREYDSKQTVTINTITKQNSLAPTPDNLKPNNEWEVAFIASFSELRQKWNNQRQLENVAYKKPPFPLPSLKDELKLRNYFFGNASQPNKKVTINPTPPLMSLLLMLDEVSVKTLLSFHIAWLEERPLDSLSAQWIYALLVLLEKPLDADISADLRVLLRYCIILRVAQQNDTPLLPMLNILITIVAKYFGQHNPDESL